MSEPSIFSQKDISTTYPPLIFYAEDDPLITRLFLQGMEEILPKFQVKFFSNGKELLNGLDLLLTQKGLLPNLILLDLHMPIKDGLSTLADIKKNEIFDPIPILMFSSSEVSVEKEQSLQLGANAFLEKEFDFEFIEEVLSKLDEYWSKLFQL